MKTKKPNRGATAGMLSLASVLSSQVEIDQVRLVSTMARLGSPPQEGPVSIEFAYSVHSKANVKEGLVLVHPIFKVKGEDRKGRLRTPVFEIEAAFLLIYKVKDFTAVTKRVLDAFGQSNGIYNAWPYWREYVQSVVGRMCLPPLTAPVFRLEKPGSSSSRK